MAFENLFKKIVQSKLLFYDKYEQMGGALQ